VFPSTSGAPAPDDNERLRVARWRDGRRAGRERALQRLGKGDGRFDGLACKRDGIGALGA